METTSILHTKGDCLDSFKTKQTENIIPSTNKSSKKCTNCSKSFSYQLSLTKHSSKCGVKQVRVFQCHHCLGKFTVKCNLERHILQRTCVQPKPSIHKCIVSGCKVHFQKQVHLINHLLEAHGDEPTYAGSPFCWTDCTIQDLEFDALQDFQEWLEIESYETKSYYSSGGQHCSKTAMYVTYHCQFDKESRNHTSKSNKKKRHTIPDLNCPARICVKYKTDSSTNVSVQYFATHNHPVLSEDETKFIIIQAKKKLQPYEIVDQLRRGVALKDGTQNITTIQNKIVTSQLVANICQ